MEDLIKKLQSEVGITEDQAIKAMAVIKDEMEKGDFDINWDKFFKGKYDDFLGKAKNALGDVEKQTTEYTNKFADKVDDFTDSARGKLKDLSQKAADFFDDDNKKKS